jgi:hypothetical protein
MTLAELKLSILKALEEGKMLYAFDPRVAFELVERLEKAEAKIAALEKELSRCENALLEAGEWL